MYELVLQYFPEESICTKWYGVLTTKQEKGKKKRGTTIVTRSKSDISLLVECSAIGDKQKT